MDVFFWQRRLAAVLSHVSALSQVSACAGLFSGNRVPFFKEWSPNDANLNRKSCAQQGEEDSLEAAADVVSEWWLVPMLIRLGVTKKGEREEKSNTNLRLKKQGGV